jgi:hypothetical protein
MIDPEIPDGTIPHSITRKSTQQPNDSSGDDIIPTMRMINGKDPQISIFPKIGAKKTNIFQYLVLVSPNTFNLPFRYNDKNIALPIAAFE